MQNTNEQKCQKTCSPCENKKLQQPLAAVAFISNVVYDTYFTIIFLAVPFS